MRETRVQFLAAELDINAVVMKAGFPIGKSFAKRPWRMMGWAESSKMDVIRSSPLPKPPEHVCQDVREAKEISRQAACTARSVVLLAHLLRPSAFPRRSTKLAERSSAGAKRAFAGPNQNPRRGFWSPHSSSPAPQGSDRAPYNSPKRQELRCPSERSLRT